MSWLLTASVAVLYVIVIATRGPMTGADSLTYSRWADGLIAAHFHYGDFANANAFNAPLQLYAVWITMVAVAKIAVGEAWPLVILAVNAASLGLIGAALIRLTDGWRQIFAACALAVSGDLLLFAPYLLSDVFFTAISTLALASLLERQPLLTAASTATSVFTRPSSPPLLAVTALRWSGLSQPSRAWKVVAIGVPLALVMHAVIIHSPWFSDWPWLTYVRGGYHAGAVIRDRPGIGACDTLLEIAGITLLRFIVFFSPWVPGYSIGHTAINLLFFVPVYAGCVVGIRTAVDREAVSTLLLYLLCLAGFHAMQEIDFDHRYRLPAIPALIMLATLSRRAGGTSTRR